MTKNPMTPRCCNANPGTYGHECGDVATHAGKHPFSSFDGHRGMPYFVGGRCPNCLEHGYENKGMNEFAPVIHALPVNPSIWYRTLTVECLH